MNYSPETTKYMISVYEANPCRETVEKLANELEKTVKSIIGKLSRERVYKRQVYTTKRGETPITKAEIVATISEALGFGIDDLVGLDKTPKLILAKMQERLEELAKKGEGKVLHNLHDSNE
jgi:hypothetical protein